MLSIAYVILPFQHGSPSEAIRASLAPFQSGGRGDLPDSSLTFQDNTAAVRRAFEAHFTFTDRGDDSVGVDGDFEDIGWLNAANILDEMRQRGQQCWPVRFADTMGIDGFSTRFCNCVEGGPLPGTYGQWLNPLGRWDFWELGHFFDGRITGQPNLGPVLFGNHVSSGESWDRLISCPLDPKLTNSGYVGDPATSYQRSAGNIEFCATLLADALSDREHAFPSSIVLPPGWTEDRLRWLDALPKPGPVEAFARLGLRLDARWEEVVEEAYLQFHNHWVAGIVYHN